MNIAVAGNLPAMQAVSQHAQATWDVLRLQISPFTSVVTIDGHIFKSLSDDEKHWISAQYRAIVNVNVIYVHDSHVFRVFLARADMFPPGSVLPAVPGSIPALINPALLGNAASIPAANSSVNPRVEPVRNTTVKHAKILRPPNAFILYRKAHHEAVKAAHPGIHNNEISVILGTQWQQEDAGVRAQYKAQAAQLKQEHMEKHPDYQYQPRKASELRRRMTKKKAAALGQNKPSGQGALGTGSLPSDHDFSNITGNWNSIDLTSVVPYNNINELYDQVHMHNNQPGLRQYVDGSYPEISITDNAYKEILMPGTTWVGGANGLGLNPDEEAFNAYINTFLCQSTDASS